MPTPAAYYTTATGPGSTTDQPIPGSSLGGFVATNTWGGSVIGDLFGRASSIEITDGRADVRAVWIHNPDTTVTLADVRVFVTPVTAGGAGLSIGVDPRPASYPDSLSSQVVEVTSAYSSPAGVSFTSPSSYTDGIAIGDLVPEAGRGLWLRRLPTATALAAEAVDITIQGTNGTIVRRVYWTCEPAALPTRPPSTPRLPVATPSPIRRLAVDFLSVGGSRITWEIDQTLRDTGPYVFQLQNSRIGTPDATDWADVGPAAQDATYLLDATNRLWGAAKDVFYRIVLTTATTSYTSKPVGAFGRLNMAGWLLASEVLRKEELILRRLAGVDGFLLKARRYGTRCSCVDPYTGEVGNSSDPVCYGTGYSGGFMPPVALSFALPTPRSKKERVAYNETAGMILPDVMRVRVVATTNLASRDVWVSRGGDERWYVHQVDVVASWQEVPLIYEAVLRLAPRSDVIYTYVVTRPVEVVPEWLQPTTMDL